VRSKLVSENLDCKLTIIDFAWEVPSDHLFRKVLSNVLTKRCRELTARTETKEMSDAFVSGTVSRRVSTCIPPRSIKSRSSLAFYRRTLQRPGRSANQCRADLLWARTTMRHPSGDRGSTESASVALTSAETNAFETFIDSHLKAALPPQLSPNFGYGE
jgi:hypothetical protein